MGLICDDMFSFLGFAVEQIVELEDELIELERVQKEYVCGKKCKTRRWTGK